MVFQEIKMYSCLNSPYKLTALIFYTRKGKKCTLDRYQYHRFLLSQPFTSCYFRGKLPSQKPAIQNVSQSYFVGLYFGFMHCCQFLKMEQAKLHKFVIIQAFKVDRTLTTSLVNTRNLHTGNKETIVASLRAIFNLPTAALLFVYILSHLVTCCRF